MKPKLLLTIIVIQLQLLLTISMTLFYTACETRMTNVHSQQTAALIQRRDELQNKEREDDYGIMYGPTRWISHATDERASRRELQAINSELAARR
jgi:hypothetical protein